jgi:hypothetical protein
MISTRFGTRTIGGYSGRAPDFGVRWRKAGFLPVAPIDADMLILTERDRHVNVMICVSKQDLRLTITGAVVTPNALGRFFMLPVAPIHRLIVRHDLRSARPRLQDIAPAPRPVTIVD